METLGLWLTLFFVFILLAISALFSGAETALTAASKSRIHALSKTGNRRALIVSKLISDLEGLIGAILLGNNLVNILATSLATSVLIILFGDTGVVYATLAMTALIVIFAEVLPKTYAISNPDRAALIAAPVLRVLVLILAPITGAIQFIVRTTLKLFNISTQDEHVLSAHEELRGAIDLHHHEGGVVKRDRDMLGGILDLQELEVSEIMVHRKSMGMIDAGQANETIVQQVLASPHTRIPLWKDDPDNIVGVVHAKDLLRAVAAAQGKFDSIDVMSIITKPWFVPETTAVRAQLNAFLRKKSHFALVVDEYGALMGLLTLEDILEEIVGDIADEHDLAVPSMRSHADGSISVDGAVTIRDLNRSLDWDLPDSEATTIAGLVIHEAQTIPDVGQKFTFHGVRFEIVSRQRNQITALKITHLRERTRAIQ